MDANRYFEQMHQVMSAQKRDFSLILSVKVQDQVPPYAHREEEVLVLPLLP